MAGYWTPRSLWCTRPPRSSLWRAQIAISRASRARSARSEVDTRQPTIARLKATPAPLADRPADLVKRESMRYGVDVIPLDRCRLTMYYGVTGSFQVKDAKGRLA